ncbi:MAG: DUF2083 domain-containing protein [Burkholderiales bacterium]|nr:DUF2083 domain-containing protein [Burkholderiales bacterium]
MRRSLIGPTLRERRRQLGITQSKLAAEVGISASYLNLIESDKRNIAGSLLKRLADALGLALDELDGAAERRLVDDLGELAGEALLADLQLDAAGKHDLASRHRAWARALIRMHRAWLDRGQTVSVLSDRLNQNPFLGSAVHSMLSQVAAIRSSSEILETVSDLEPAQRQRFVAIVGNESARLAEVAKALAAFFDKEYTDARSVTPVDEVDDFIVDRNNCFPELEQAAADFRRAASIAGECSTVALTDYLARAHAVRVVVAPSARLDVADVRHHAAFDSASRTLVLAEDAPRPTQRFQLARLATELFDRQEAIDGVLAPAGELTTDAARRRARRALSSYLAAAVLLPYEPLLEAATQQRYHVDALARRFDASFEQVCHRLVSLRRPGAAGIPFALMRADVAGFTSKRFPLPQFALPRHGRACPMWAVYQAFGAAGTMVRQLAEFPTGDRLLLFARTVEKARPAFILPRRTYSIMLACDALHADRTVYGDGLDLSSAAPAVPVGPSCRLCVRRDCLYREEEPIVAA